MVHRPADSRLLSNLLQQEKEYSKHLSQLLESSNASLASFTAYAAASPPPGSYVIMSVAGALAAVDEALRRYSLGVDQWRDTMRALRDAEEEVGNIIRDREILVTRLIKASTSKKNSGGNVRDSLLSASTLSLSLGDSPALSRPLSASFSSSTKLAAAQSELQACETHLAAKERELTTKRRTALRDGLGARAKALVECGFAWTEVGKEALRSLEELQIEQRHSSNNSMRSYSSIEPSQFERRHSNSHNSNKFIPFPESPRHSSEFPSIGPLESPSQVTLNQSPLNHSQEQGPANIHSVLDPPATPTAEDPNSSRARPQSGASTATAGSSIFYDPTTTTYKLETVTYAPAVALHVGGSGALVGNDMDEQENGPYHMQFRDEDLPTTMRMPAPHAIEGYAYEMPTAGPSGYGFTRTLSGSRPLSGASSNFDDGRRHQLERRITEEELRRQSISEHDVEDDDDMSVLEDERKLVQEGKIEVVENPRFMTEARKKELEREEAERKQETTPTKETEKKKFKFFPKSEPQAVSRVSLAIPPTESQEPTPIATPPMTSANATPTKSFLGSLRGFFKSPTSSTRVPKPTTNDAAEPSSDDDSDVELSSPSKSKGGSGLQALFSSGNGARKSPTKKTTKSSAWETRTDKNLRELASARRGQSFDVAGSGGVGLGIAGVAVKNAGVVNAAPEPAIVPREPVPVRERRASDGGSSRPKPAAAPGGRKLKKARAGGPPVSPSAAAAATDLRRLVGDKNGSAVSVASVVVASVPAPATVSAAPTPAPVPPFPPVPVFLPAPAPAIEPRRPTRALSPNAVKGVGRRRSASVDLGSQNRKSWISLDENSNEKEGGMIVDLGRRRRAVSDVGGPVDVKEKEPAPPLPTSQPLPLSQPSPTSQSLPTTQPPPTSQPPTRPRPLPTPPAGAKTTTNSAGVETAALGGYSSDTAATSTIVRKNSLTKKKKSPTQITTPVESIIQQPTPPPTTTTSTPKKRASIKSTTSTPTKSPGASSTPGTPAGHGATVLQAGGGHPSGTLVSYPGWDAQAQVWGGGLSRNPSVVSVASAPAGAGAGGGRKQTTLGQGMGVAGRPSHGVGAQGTSMASKASVGSPLVHPTAPSTSLMSIVADVSRSNRGWSQELKARQQSHGVGGPRTAAAGMVNPLDATLVRAPQPMPRDVLESLDVAEALRSRAPGGGGAIAKPTKGTTGMVEIKAPGSVFDLRQAMVIASADPTSSSKAAAAAQSSASAVAAAQPMKQKSTSVERRKSVRNTEGKPASSATPPNPSTPATPATPPSTSTIAKEKIPLRSAMRATSRSPSPAIAAGTSQIQIQHRDDGVLPLAPPNGSMPLAGDVDGTMATHMPPHQHHHHHRPQRRRSKRDRKGKAPVRHENLEDSGGDGDGDRDRDRDGGGDDGDGDESSGSSYSDQEESEVALGAAIPSAIPSAIVGASANAATDPAVLTMNGSAVPTVNGYGSEISHATASVGSLGQHDLQQQQQQTQLNPNPNPQGQSSAAKPPPPLPPHIARRRKSVRVSLQPTFSPPPPAIEYDEEEEAQQHYQHQLHHQHQPRRRGYEAPPPPAPINLVLAPKPLHASAVVVPGPAHAHAQAPDETDMWEDSGEDEEPQYVTAKRLLTRAAKRDKDVNLMIAKRKR